MQNIRNEEAVGELLLACESNAGPSYSVDVVVICISIVIGGVIYPDIDRAPVGSMNEPLIVGLGFTDVRDEAVGWVSLSPEIEAIEEGRARIFGVEAVHIRNQRVSRSRKQQKHKNECSARPQNE